MCDGDNIQKRQVIEWRVGFNNTDPSHYIKHEEATEMEFNLMSFAVGTLVGSTWATLALSILRIRRND